MPQSPSPARPSPRRVGLLGLALAGLVGGCGAGGLLSSAPPSPAATATPSTAPPAATGEPTPSPTPVVLASPPAAMVAGLASGAADGTLGTFTWDGAGTDAPWIVPADAGRASPGAALGVVFEPAVDAASWTARWAPVTGSGPGDVASGVDGVGPVAVTAPDETGAWGLQLEASFGQGRSGTWYWRLEVGP